MDSYTPGGDDALTENTLLPRLVAPAELAVGAGGDGATQHDGKETVLPQSRGDEAAAPVADSLEVEGRRKAALSPLPPPGDAKGEPS